MSANNSYRFTVPTNDKYINLPLEIKWDLGGRQDDIDRYERTVIEELTKPRGNFEISRYSHKNYFPNEQTSIQYKFHFYNSPLPVSATTPFNVTSDWVNNYRFPLANPSGFSAFQMYYFLNPFTNSFFKLDFYDSPESTTQKNYFTIILPVQQGFTESVSLSPLIPNVQVKIPWMKLDFVGDKEGYFIYWLRSPEYINITDFYMSAKFFDARQGVFVRMMNTPQGLLNDKFIFDTEQYFYYKVTIDYDTKDYQVFDYSGLRIGTGTPINWYEYVNP